MRLRKWYTRREGKKEISTHNNRRGRVLKDKYTNINAMLTSLV